MWVLHMKLEIDIAVDIAIHRNQMLRKDKNKGRRAALQISSHAIVSKNKNSKEKNLSLNHFRE